MENKLDKLKKILEVSSRDTISAKEIEKFLVLVLNTIKTERESFKNLSDEQLSTISEKVSFIDSIKDNFKVLFVDEINEAKKLLNEISKIKSTPGKDGNDYVLTNSDKEEIASLIEVPIVEKTEIIKEIPQEIIGEEIVNKINELPTDNEDLKIDAKHIKNLPKPQAQFIGGGSSGIKEIIAGTNVTVDNTNPQYPIVSSVGGGTVGPGTINEIAYFDTTTSIASLPVTTYPSLTELSYVKGVTSAIQTQLNGKAPSLGADDNYVTDAQLIVIGNTSGTNTGDQDLSSYLTSATAASTYQPLDTQLTSLAGLSYTGNSLKVVRVNAGETAFELATVSGGVSFGADNQIPFVNAGGTDFDYVSTFVYDSGKLGIGTASPIGTLHTVLASASPATTAWTSNQAVFGSASSTGAALGITVGSSVVTLQALAPNTAWQDLTFMGAAGYWYGGGNNIGIHVTSGGNIGIRQATASEALDVLGRGLFSQGVIINEGGTDSDTRIESDTHTDAFFLDGTNGEITLGAYGAGSITGTATYGLAVDTTGKVIEVALGGGISDGDKGDITVSGSGATWTIDNGVVSLAKQADVATGTVFYRKTAGTGSPEVQTLATLKTDLGLSGTNTGDQTSIVGITGTKAQFDTAVTDGNFLYTDAIGVSVQAYDADLTTWAGITPGTGVATALAVNVGSAGAFVTFNGALGTPSSGTVTNLTGTASININGTVGATTPTTVKGTTIDATTGFLLNGAATANKILKANGTNIVLSTETYAAPGTSGNVMTSDGTNWTSAAPAGGGNPGWDFVSYNTATGTDSITVSGLNINTDGGTYMVIVQAAGTATCDYTMQFGSETAGYTWGINRISTAGGAFSFGTDSSTSSAGLLLAGSAADVKSMQGKIMLYEGLKFDGTNTQITAEYNIIGTGTGASNDAYEKNDGVGITENIESTLTSFKLLASGGATPNWKVWVFKAATS